MIGWMIFAVLVIAIVGWRTVGFFRRRQAEAKRRKARSVDRDYEAYYADPLNVRSQQQINEEFKMLMRW